MSQPVSPASSSSLGRGGLLDRGEGGQPPLEQLVAHELLVLLVAIGVLVVRGREQPPQRRVVGGGEQHVAELLDEAQRAARARAAGGAIA